MSIKRRRILKRRLFLVVAFVLMAVFFFRNRNSGNQEVEYTIQYASSPYEITYANPYHQEHLLHKNSGISIYEDSSYRSLFGVDVSEHQGKIDFETLKNQGVDFVMIRLGYRGYKHGNMVMDEYFEENYRKARNAGIPVGVYFFSQAINEEEGRQEANFVLDTLSNRSLQLPIAMDLEYADDHDRVHDLDYTKRSLIAKAFMDTINNHKYHAMIYTSSSWLERELDLDLLENSCSIWLANHQTIFPNYGQMYSMWQYHDQGRIKGVSTIVDFNILMVPKNSDLESMFEQ